MLSCSHLEPQPPSTRAHKNVYAHTLASMRRGTLAERVDEAIVRAEVDLEPERSENVQKVGTRP